jgi:hypothetical protein
MAFKKENEIPDNGYIDLQIAAPIKYIVSIVGQSDILFNRMIDQSETPAEGVLNGSKKSAITKDKAEVERQIWREKAYFRPESEVLYIPGENIHQCMVDGASYWGMTIPGRGKTQYTGVVKAGVICQDISLATLDSEGNYVEATKADLVSFGRSVNGTPTKGKGSKVYRIRPSLESWNGTFLMTVIDARLTPQILRTIVSYAGLYRGLGDWRPNHGRFELEHLGEVMGKA